MTDEQLATFKARIDSDYRDWDTVVAVAIAAGDARILLAEVHVLRKQVGDARRSLIECADELETALRANYEGMLDYPHNREKLERDLEPVYRARAALARADSQDTPS